MTSSDIKYLTVLAELLDRNGRARAVDLADRLLCSRPSVIRGMEKLIRGKYVCRGSGRDYLLTEAGRQTAERYARSIDFLKGVLVRGVGLRPACASADAVAILGAVSDECLEKLTAMADAARLQPGTENEIRR